jgi:hypothetical protein
MTVTYRDHAHIVRDELWHVVSGAVYSTQLSGFLDASCAWADHQRERRFTSDSLKFTEYPNGSAQKHPNMHYKLYPEIIRNCQIEKGYPPHFLDKTAYDPSGDFGRQKEHIVHLIIYSPWCLLMAAPRFAARLPHLWVCPWAQCSSRTWGTAWKRNVQAWVDGALEWKKMYLDPADT